MLPGRVGNKVTTPAMRQLVGYHVNVLTVLEDSSQPWHRAHRLQPEGKRGEFLQYQNRRRRRLGYTSLLNGSIGKGVLGLSKVSRE